MPRNGSGNYSLPTNAWNPAINGVSATPADWQALINDVAAALQTSVASDGQTPITGNLQMTGHLLTGAGAPSGAGMSLRWEQLTRGADIPSSASVTIPLEGQFFAVTGSTAITSIAATIAGRLVYLKFDAGIVLTNSTNLIMPAGVNVTTAADDIVVFLSISPGVWKCVSYPNQMALKAGDGTQNFNVASLNSGQLAGMRNKVINGNFAINQRAVSGTVTLAAGAYGHDRFKAGASGCTYTFSTTANVTTLNITAGSLMQVIEGINLQSGTHVLSWQGTAQGRIDSTAYGASGITGTATGGTNQTVEFGVGTLSLVQYEPGTVATPFEMRSIAAEINLCQRYFESGIVSAGAAYPTAGSATAFTAISFHVEKRVVPTLTLTGTLFNFNVTSTGFDVITTNGAAWHVLQAGAAGRYNAAASFSIDSEI